MDGRCGHCWPRVLHIAEELRDALQAAMGYAALIDMRGADEGALEGLYAAHRKAVAAVERLERR